MATKTAPKKIGAKRALNTTHVELHVKKEKGKPRGDPNATAPYRFKPGQSGNPGGRPKGTGKIRISDAYAGMMSQEMPDEFKIAVGVNPEDKCTWAEGIALQLLKKSINVDSCKPSFKAITELREVTEGKLPDKAELGGPNGSALSPGVGLPVVNVNFKSPTVGARPIDGPVPSGVVVVAPPAAANVPVAEVEESSPIAVDLPEFERGF